MRTAGHIRPLFLRSGFAALLLSCSQLLGANVKLAWDANSEANLAGYKVYYRTAAGSYGTPIVLGLQTSCDVPINAPGTYAFAVTAYTRTGEESGRSNEVTTTLADTMAPSIRILSPNAGTGSNFSSATLSLSGTATDDFAVTRVTWVNDRGGSGTASGTSSWSIPSVSLQPGTNFLTVNAWDAAGHRGTVTLNVTFTPPAQSVATSTSVASSLNPAPAGISLTMTATVVSGNPAMGSPTGTVVFRSASSVLGSASLNAEGRANLASVTLPAGNHSIFAEYQGDSLFLASSAALTQSIANQSANGSRIYLPFVTR